MVGNLGFQAGAAVALLDAATLPFRSGREGDVLEARSESAKTAIYLNGSNPTQLNGFGGMLVPIGST